MPVHIPPVLAHQAAREVAAWHLAQERRDVAAAAFAVAEAELTKRTTAMREMARAIALVAVFVPPATGASTAPRPPARAPAAASAITPAPPAPPVDADDEVMALLQMHAAAAKLTAQPVAPPASEG